MDPGETKVGSLIITDDQLVFAEANTLGIYLGCAFDMYSGCSGSEFNFEIDLSSRQQEPISDDVSRFLWP